MARADRRRAEREARHARRPERRHKGGGSRGRAQVVERQLFFTRLRRGTKPIFLLLAVVFALTFVFLGVGSGSAGIGSLLGNINIFGNSSSGPSVSSAEKKLAKNPRDAAAYLELAQAYEAKKDTPSAIAAYQQYAALRPTDVSALTSLASLEMERAASLKTAATAATQAQQQQAFAPDTLASSTSPIGRALASDPIAQALSGQQSQNVSAATSAMQSAYQQAAQTYTQLLTTGGQDSNIELDLADASIGAGNYTGAINAYQEFIKLSPQDPVVKDVKARINALKAYAAYGASPLTTLTALGG